jgi:hypothetical protein
MTEILTYLILGFIAGLVPFAVILWCLWHPETWWPRR